LSAGVNLPVPRDLAGRGVGEDPLAPRGGQRVVPLASAFWVADG
jgi:hypothetical protein